MTLPLSKLVNKSMVYQTYNNFIPRNNAFQMISIPIQIYKGIKLIIIYIILKNYELLQLKKIVITNNIYRNLMKKLFPQLNFIKDYNIKSSENYYFNIRKIIKNQDVVIDYINNYDIYIPSKKIHLIPWYDNSDPLIVYYYKNKYSCVNKWINTIYKFNYYKRYNYNNYNWDKLMEYKILLKYLQFASNNKIKLIFSNNIPPYYVNNNILYTPYVIFNKNRHIHQNVIKSKNGSFDLYKDSDDFLEKKKIIESEIRELNNKKDKIIKELTDITQSKKIISQETTSDNLYFTEKIRLQSDLDNALKRVNKLEKELKNISNSSSTFTTTDSVIHKTTRYPYTKSEQSRNDVANTKGDKSNVSSTTKRYADKQPSTIDNDSSPIFIVATDNLDSLAKSFQNLNRFIG